METSYLFSVAAMGGVYWEQHVCVNFNKQGSKLPINATSAFISRRGRAWETETRTETRRVSSVAFIPKQTTKLNAYKYIRAIYVRTVRGNQ